MSQRKKRLTTAKVRAFSKALDDVHRAIDQLTGADGIGYYLPVRYVDALSRARRAIERVGFELDEAAAEQGCERCDRDRTNVCV